MKVASVFFWLLLSCMGLGFDRATLVNLEAGGMLLFGV